MKRRWNLATWRPCVPLALAAALCVFGLVDVAAQPDSVGAAASPAAPTVGYIDWGRVWEITVGGMVVVMLVLSAMATAVALLNRIEIRLHARRDAEAAARPPAGEPAGVTPAAPAPEAASAGNEVDVVIAAAVAAFLQGRRFRVSRVRLAEPASSWAQMGRVGIQTSHNIQKR
ncbi:MAG TPA: OadG family transporter subunit [Candidatus Sumerlaeota bacterium]|nr:OadG family transporter subunit [Candidatus Sumerlaeota bacterium]HOR29322.1 OadG family transporter subunit [Candidatus Sumerlaeota bacterium]HPK03609.1 OadG family transporter subunit [Candidatus Sumerlaeota bacterium]